MNTKEIIALLQLPQQPPPPSAKQRDYPIPSEPKLDEFD